MVFMEKLVLFFIWVSLFEGFNAKYVPYDYSANIQCMPEPPKPQYGGGIILNPDFSNGLDRWTAYGGDTVAISASPSGNKFAMAHGRRRPYHSASQKLQLQKDTHYVLSAWLRVSQGSANVKAVMATAGGAFAACGAIVVQSGCWNMLKGGMTSRSAGPAHLFFETDATVDIWLDSVSLQPFTFAQWNTHRDRSVKKIRKKTVKLVAKDASGKPLANAQFSINLVRKGFPFGNAMTKEILSNAAYEKWFTSRFTVATFENEMKWYSTEYNKNQEDYRIPDAMLKLAQKYNIKVRGHNVFWDDQNSQMKWVKPLNRDQLKAAMAKRLKNVVSRYAGKLIAWDVVNENLHFSFFEGIFGKDASAQIYNQVAQLDKTALLFMNEFNTLEQPGDMAATPAKYLAKLKQIKSYPGNGGLKLAIGLESHFTSPPNIPFIRASLDTLAQAKVPIWLTEVDVTKGPNQVHYLEQALREGFAHPAVQGIVMWAAWHAKGCYVMCLTDNNFKNLPAGNLVDKLIAEWSSHKAGGVTKADGVFDAELFHGEYNVTVSHPSLKFRVAQSLTVDAISARKYTIKV